MTLQTTSIERILGSGRELKTGTFIKTAAPQMVEILGLAGLDFAVIDAEHAPFDRMALDLMLMAGRAANLPLLVRVSDPSAATILQVLDLGAAGIVVPHVDSADAARQVLAWAKYRGGRRGFSNAPRAAGYGTLCMKAALDAGDRNLVICQIESVEGLAAASAIAALDGVDALFIGRADLALAMGHEDSRAEPVTEATRSIIKAALAANKVAMMFVAGIAEREKFAAEGARCFVVGSDQSMLRQAAAALVSTR